MLPVRKIRILMQKDYKHRKKLHIKKRQGVSYTAFSIKASLTLEAALVLPIFLAALVAVIFFLQAIQVQARIQQSLYNQVKKVSGYAYYINIADMTEKAEQVMQAEYVKYAVINEIGRDYLEKSAITGGSNGIHINFWVDAKKGILDVELDYSMDIPFNLLGFPAIKFSSRQRCHTWIGKTTDDEEQGREAVYVTANGEVYHLYSDCSYLVSSIKNCKGTEIADKRNNSGEKYKPCQLCCKENEELVVAFYTDYGNRYHSLSLCSNLHSNVFSVDKETAQENYRLCSKCEKRK